MQKKNKGIAIVLCLFLGCIGIHQFYLENITRGMMYLLFSWTGIPLLLACIDLFVLLFGKKYADIVD